MTILKLCILAITIAFCAIFLKSNNSQLFPFVIVVGGIMLLLFAIDYLYDTLVFLIDFSENLGIDKPLVSFVLKIVAIGYAIEFTASSLIDLGFSGVADKLMICGRILIVSLSIPVLKTLYEVIISLVNTL